MIRSESRQWWRRGSTDGGSHRYDAATEERLEAPVSSPAFWAMVGFTFVLIFAPQAHFPVLAPLRLAFSAAVISLVSYLADRMARRAPIIVMSRELGVAACLAGWALLTVPLALWPGGSLDLFQELYLKSLLIFWLLSNVVSSPLRLRQMCWVLALLSVPLAGTAIGNYVEGVLIRQGGMVVERIQGYNAPLTSNPNDLALMLNLILPLSIALFFQERRGGRRLLLAAMIGLSVVGVIVTFSRGGFVTLASLTVMYLWKLRRRPERRWAYAVAALAVISIPLLPGGYIERLETVTDSSKDLTGSSQARWRDSIAAVRIVVNHPIIGAGIGGDVLALNTERGDFWLATHNVYLQYAVDLGLPGLVLFVLLLFGCIRRLGELLRRTGGRNSGDSVSYLVEGVQASLYTFAVAALFHPGAYHFYFYYIAGLAVALINMYDARGVASEPMRPAPRQAGP